MMLVDSFGRTLHTLRVSVTSACDLRCVYCAGEGAASVNENALLPWNDLFDIVKTAVRLGLSRIRLTGGEPLLREGLVEFVERVARCSGVQDLALTTNGTALAQWANPLAKAGLQRVNVSLDALNPERYRFLTGGGEVGHVLEGLEAAQRAGLKPIKLNCVIENSPDEPDARDVATFGENRGYMVRFIPRMNREQGTFGPVLGGSGGHCSDCGRLRLTCQGGIRPCLFSKEEFDAVALGAEAALRQAAAAKPAHGFACVNEPMWAVGG